MEAYNKENLKKIGFVSLIFLILVGILFSLTFLDFFKENTFKNIVVELLTSSQISKEYKNINYIEPTQKYSNLVFPSVFEVRNEKKQFYIFFVRLTGKYGVQTGVFLYDENMQKAQFCGIVGQDFNKKISYYGFNEGVLEHWCNKIRLFEKKLRKFSLP